MATFNRLLGPWIGPGPGIDDYRDGPRPGTGDDGRLAEYLMFWCRAVYTHSHTGLDLPLLSTIAYVRGQPPLVGVFEDADHTMYVLVRGTYTLTDLWYGIWCWQVPNPPPGPSRVHAGFREVADLCMPALVAQVEQRQPAHIVFCGHSMGGVVGILLAQQLHLRGWDVSALSVGSPAFATPGTGTAYPFPVHTRLHVDDTVWRVHGPRVAHAGEVVYTESVRGSPHDMSTYFTTAALDCMRPDEEEVECLEKYTVWENTCSASSPSASTSPAPRTPSRAASTTPATWAGATISWWPP